MQYDRCGMTAALGRRFDESYGNNGNYEIYEISAPPKLAVWVKMRAVSTRGAYLRGAPFTHYSHNSHNSHYSHFMRRPHEVSGMTGYTKLARCITVKAINKPPPRHIIPSAVPKRGGSGERKSLAVIVFPPTANPRQKI